MFFALSRIAKKAISTMQCDSGAVVIKKPGMALLVGLQLSAFGLGPKFSSVS